MIGIALAGGFIAFVNGANDVSKGVATLVGAGITDYRRAILWGTVWTAVGAIVGALVAKAMLATFGSGLLAHGATPSMLAATAVLLGAGVWVLLATLTGMPVSTTHAIVGSLVGVVVVAHGLHGIAWHALGGKIVLPLVLSPFVSMLLAAALLRRPRDSGATGRAMPVDCLCAELEEPRVAIGRNAAAMLSGAPRQVAIVRASQAECARERPFAARLTLDHLHWLTSGATSLARGANDAPKIAALVLAGTLLVGGRGISTGLVFLSVILGMVLGSALAGRRVTRVLAEKVTVLDHREGFVANLVTSALVMAGALYGLPMSTTHVSSGAIVGVGVGAGKGTLDWRMLAGIAVAWVVTLPGAALLGIAGYVALRAASG